MTSRRLMAARVHVAEFTLDIRHIAGKENIVADMLSRPPSLITAFPVFFTALGLRCHRRRAGG